MARGLGDDAMDQNTILGLVLAFVGINDVVLSWALADRLKMQPPLRKVLTYGGLALIVLGGLLATRVIRFF
jgi:hypothetical protein